MNESRLLIALVAVAAIVMVVWAVCIVPTHVEQLRCAGIKSQAEAQHAYSKGATWLDGDGDRIACEELP